MQFLARFVRGETAVGMFKRFLKDTMVSGCATLCVSLALSNITKTMVPSATPRPEAVRTAEVEPVQPLRETAQPTLFVPADQGRSLTSVAVGTEVRDAAQRGTIPADNAAPKDRPRRTAVPAPQLVQPTQAVQAARSAEPVRLVRAVEVQPLPAPTASAPLDIAAVAQRPAGEKPQAGGRFGAIKAAVTFLRESGEAVTTTATEVKGRVWGATGGILTSVLR